MAKTQSQINSEYYARNREKQIARAKQYRIDNPEKVKAASKKWNEANIDHLKEIRKKWDDANREKVRLHNKRSRLKEDPALDRARQARYHLKHASKINAKSRAWYEANKERATKTRETYRVNNAGKVTAWLRAREIAKLSAIPAWADLKAMEAIYEAARAMTMITMIKHEVDHIVPLKSKLVCGLHCEANMQILTKRTNVQKGNRVWPDMWEQL